MNIKLTQMLGLPGVIVKSQKKLEKALILEVESQSKTASCPTCQKTSHRIHQNHRHLIRDFPWKKTKIFLNVNRRQFKCNHCQKPFSEELNFVRKRKKCTDRYAQGITEQFVKGNLLIQIQRKGETYKVKMVRLEKPPTINDFRSISPKKRIRSATLAPQP